MNHEPDTQKIVKGGEKKGKGKKSPFLAQK